MHSTVVVSFFLLCAITVVVPSNPDSEIVQDIAKDGKSTQKRSLDTRSVVGRPSIAVVTNRYTGVKILRPYYTDMGIVWREVATSSGNDQIRIRNRGGYLDVSSATKDNGTATLRPPVGQDFPGFQPNINDPRMGQPLGNGYVPVQNVVPYSNVNNGNVLSGNVPNGNVPKGNVPNGNVPNGNVPKGNVPNDNVPKGNVPNGNVPKGNVPTDNVLNGNPPEGSLSDNLDTTTLPEGYLRPSPSPNQNNFDVKSTRGPGRVSPDANLFAAIVNDFTFKLVERMELKTNFVVSPISIFVALSMSYLGAGGRTKTQMEQVLGLNNYAVHGMALHHGISDLLSMISPDSDEYQLFVANGLFLGMNLTVEEPFKEYVQRFYNAELKNLNFGDQDASLQAINEWVSRRTMDAIPSLIDSPLSEYTRLVLLNAIFFKGIWKTSFPLTATYNAEFVSADGSPKMVPFMNLLRQTFPIHRSSEHRHSFLKLPYKGDQVSMVIALPFEFQEQPMPSVTDQILCHMRDAMREVQLGAVSIPKFRLESLESLRRPLMEVGVRDLFDRSVNLTGMSQERDLSVSDVLHKAVVDVNEEGTTASASTFVGVSGQSGLVDRFEASHPFAFYIVHEASGLVLFYGKVFDLDGVTDSDRGANRNEGYRAPQDNVREPQRRRQQG